MPSKSSAGCSSSPCTGRAAARRGRRLPGAAAVADCQRRVDQIRRACANTAGCEDEPAQGAREYTTRLTQGKELLRRCEDLGRLRAGRLAARTVMSGRRDDEARRQALARSCWYQHQAGPIQKQMRAHVWTRMCPMSHWASGRPDRGDGCCCVTVPSRDKSQRVHCVSVCEAVNTASAHAVHGCRTCWFKTRSQFRTQNKICASQSFRRRGSVSRAIDRDRAAFTNHVRPCSHSRAPTWLREHRRPSV
jgi:hypothetical protein